MDDKNPFKLLSSKEIYKNPWISLREDVVVRPGGKVGIFGVTEILSGSTVLCLDKERNILLVKEYKYALEKVVLECVSGGLDDGETSLQAAKRELYEELGGHSERWTDLGFIDPFTSIVSCKNFIFLAQDVILNDKSSPDEGEVLELVKMPFNDALQMVYSGDITHAASVVAILRTHLLLNQ